MGTRAQAGSQTKDQTASHRQPNSDETTGSLSRRGFLIAAGAAMSTRAIFGQSAISPLSQDRHRPRYHLMPPSSWLNDPNGPLYWRGKYHLFYQYAPTISNFGLKYWGHALSSDLVHWKNLGIALAPTPGGPDKNGCWSGSAVIHDGVPTLIYTGATWSEENERAARAKGLVPERQMVATAADPKDDNLLHWTKISENPVLPSPPAGLKVTGWRDPCVWREGKTWCMVIGSGEAGVGGMALLYTSPDLKTWTYLHPLAVARPDANALNRSRPWGAMWECPDFFLLNGKPVLLVARGNSFLIGSYSDRKFQQQYSGQIDYGSAAYAQKTMEDGKGRRIWWAWLHEKRSMKAQAAAGWAGVMSLPRLLTLQSDRSLGVEPVPELKVLRRDARHISACTIAEHGPLLLDGVRGDCLEIEAEFDPGSARQFGLRVRSNREGTEQTLVGYDRDTSQIFSDTSLSSADPETETAAGAFSPNRGVQRGPLELGSQPFRLRIFVDASVIESFTNGRVSLSDRVYPADPASLGVGLFAKGGAAHLRSMTVWTLAPISPDRLTSGEELFRV